MKKLVCFGDSNTYGYIPAVGGRYDAGTRWTGLLQSLLPEYEVVEAGLNGRTTVFEDEKSPDRNGSRALESIMRENADAECYIIMLGTNDCKIKFHNDASTIAGGMEILISQLRLFDSSVKCIIIAPPCMTPEAAVTDMDFDTESVRVSAQLEPLYRRLALQNGCGFIPACSFIQPDSSDGVHLSPEGHRILARLVHDYLTSDEYSLL